MAAVLPRLIKVPVGRFEVGATMMAAALLLSVLGPIFSPYDPDEFVTVPFAPPSSEFVMGGDYLGRDLLSRILHGGISVISTSVLATLVGMVSGTVIGLIAGYTTNLRDNIIMRALDVLMSFPQIILVLLLVSMIGPNLTLIILMVGLSHAPRVARVARASTMQVRELDFVKAAEGMGMPYLRICAIELLPNISGPLLVELGLRLTYSIGIVASLNFLGFGIQPPASDWGLLINENRLGITLQPLGVFGPAALIALLTVSANLMTDGLARRIGRVSQGNV